MVGLNRDPPPSRLELVRLRRGSKKLTPELNGSQNYQPKDEWGEATVWASFKDGPQDVLNWPGQRMSTPNESLMLTPPITCVQVALPRNSYNTNYAGSQEDDWVRCAPGTSTDSQEDRSIYHILHANRLCLCIKEKHFTTY